MKAVSVLDAVCSSVLCLTSETWIPTSCAAAQWEEWFNNPDSNLGWITIHSRPDLSHGPLTGVVQQWANQKKNCCIVVLNKTFNAANYFIESLYRWINPTPYTKVFSGSDVILTHNLTGLCCLCSQWEEVSGLDEENNSVRIYQICQSNSSSSHWLRSGFIQRRGASQVYVELRFTIMECSSISTHHRSCKETFNLYYYQADSNEATATYPPWMENPYVKVSVLYVWHHPLINTTNYAILVHLCNLQIENSYSLI